MICQACLGIFRGNIYPRYPRRAHHQTIDGLWDAAQAGCWICHKMFKLLFRVYWSHYGAPEGISEEEKSAIMVKEIRAVKKPMNSYEDFGNLVTYTLDTDLMSTQDKLIMLYLHIEPEFFDTGRNGHQSPSDSVFLFFNLASTDKSSLTCLSNSLNQEGQPFPLNLAKFWFEDCFKNHQNCSLVKSKWYPTRLLELNAPQPGMARLISTSDILIVDSYMTLSHCWGTAEFLKLTAQTNSSLSGGIKISSLPQTFQDAIKVALLFNTRYLWIDSLCIFQDSPEDWIRESSVMGNVYRNGICNLAATRSSDSNGGLFSRRSPVSQSLLTPCCVTSLWNDTENYCWNVYPTWHDKDHFLSGPLLNRGWVVQERVMSTRILHFGSDQLYWECRNHDACETYPQGLPPIQDRLPELVAFKKNYQPLDLTSDATRIIDFWAAITSTFSQCSLTIETDKLAALSGVAKAMQKSSLDCQYLAGLWRFELEKNLLWNVGDAKQSNGKPSMRAKKYRAPTWSWASIDGAIEIAPRDYYSSKTSEIEILEATTEALSFDPTGQVKNGYLKLRGPLMTLSFRRQHSSPDWETKINGIWHRNTVFEPDIDEPCQNLHCMPVQSLTSGPHHLYHCLLLKPSTGGKVGEFNRWGVTVIDTEEHDIQQKKLWKDVKNEKWFEVLEHNGDGKYTVVII